MDILFLLWYFVIFSFLGWALNVLRILLLERKFDNKGFLTSPFSPTYGICAVICYLTMNSFVSNKIMLFSGSAIVLSLIVVCIGFGTEKVLGFKPWNLSEQKLNIGSFLTLPLAVFLGFVGLVLVALLIPLLNIILELIPFVVSLVVVTSLCGVILIDIVLSVVTTIRLQRKIKKLHGFSSLLTGDVPQEKIDELEKNYNKLFSENIIRKRLLAEFPELHNTEYLKSITAKLNEIKADNMKEYTLTFEKEDDKPFAFGFCFTKLFFLFVIGSFIGTVFETVWSIFSEGHVEVRVGLVYGPFIPVYGGGACFLTAILFKLYKLSDTLIFVISAVVGASFEYFCSWFQETLFGTVSWDYSGTAFNLDGRTNLMFALIWGFLGLVWVRYIYPYSAKMIEKIPKKIGSWVTTVLIVFMIFNAFMSISATYRWVQRDNGVVASNNFERYVDNHFNDDKMKMLFPHMQDVNDTGVGNNSNSKANKNNTNNTLNK